MASEDGNGLPSPIEDQGVCKSHEAILIPPAYREMA
ncbi:hypothetical protein Mal52_59010 [Symmachiella dynata]|uniref:Uncharacterized protein n=1 Tax=Symmachiella dynata TaxID=2527995 RepID=A0A517ZY17_9PLAN|nr:hypothetical protein Mal52_59010 [Symmachiella dynata]